MSDQQNNDRREVILVPLLVWAALLVLALISLGYAYWHGAPAHFPVAIGIAAIQAVLIALVWMQLRTASGLVRIASVAGLFFLCLLFFLTFADFLNR